MTQILVKGLPAVIKAGSSFQYSLENPSFSNSEGYTLSIEFPLRGCPANIAIFGHVHRHDIPKDPELMPCEIIAGAFYRSGSLAVMEVNDTSVKGQFLEGVDPLHEELAIDTLILNELDLGAYPETDPDGCTPDQARTGTAHEICLPWQPIGYDVVNCHAKSATEWHEDTTRLAWQPRLLSIMQRVATKSGYEIDLSPFSGTCWEKGIICNTLPPTWEISDYASALPAWTVREFFDRLGLFLKGSFAFDESMKKISFLWWQQRADALPLVEITEVVDEYSSTLNRDEQDADFLPVKRFRYRAQEPLVWKYLDAPFIRRGSPMVSEFEDYDDYLENRDGSVTESGHRVGGAKSIIYLKDIDTFFCFRTVQIYSEGHVKKLLSNIYPYAHYKELQPVGVFSPPGYDPDATYEDLEVCPVVVDYALEGKMMWLPVAGTGEAGTLLDDEFIDPSAGVTIDGKFHLTEQIYTGKSRVEAYMESDKNHSSESGKEEYFTEIYIGILHEEMKKRPYPLTDVDVYHFELVSQERFMRLAPGGAGGLAIDPRVKYSFRFVAAQIPDINCLFLIRGHTYVAQKFTATVTEHGMSSIIRGDFYRIS